MSRRLFFSCATAVLLVYFSLIVLMLRPLDKAPKSYSVTAQLLNHANIRWCREPRYRRRGPVVALASFPGSGNTWLRYLLQQATGILTGSIYVDQFLKLNGFPAENVSDGTVLVVKTHKAPPPDQFKAAVLLVRNPRDAILADFNRQHMGHLGTASRSAFIMTNQKDKKTGMNRADWPTHVSNNLGEWEELYKLWLTRFAGRVLVVLYDALVRDTRAALHEILNFLNHTVSEEDMTCAMLNKEGIYRRQNKQNFEPFTEDMYEALAEARAHVAALIADYHRRHNFTYKGPSIVELLGGPLEYE